MPVLIKYNVSGPGSYGPSEIEEKVATESGRATLSDIEFKVVKQE